MPNVVLPALCLRDWGGPLAFEQGEEEAIAQAEADGLDRLVAAGKIKERDRSRVVFLVRILVESPNKNEPLPMIRGEATA